MEKWEIPPPLAQKPLNRSSPKFAWVIKSGIPTLTQNFMLHFMFRCDTITPFAPQICENAHQVTRLVFWCFRQPTAKTPALIFTINTSNDVVSRKDAPFGGLENKFYISTKFPPKRKFFANFRRDWKFRVKKALTMAMLTCKLPLIVIVAQWKLCSQ